MSADNQTLAVYSDYVCPFCYLGRESLRRYIDQHEDPPEVEWRFFDLRGYKRGPDGDIRDNVDDGKDEDYFEQVRENVNRLSEKYGVYMDLEDARGIDSWDAQQAALYVRQTHGAKSFERFHHALFDALWVEGRDISDADVLAEVAESVGFAGQEVRDAVSDEQLAAELREQFEAATQRGVTGIPTFVYDDHAARGAVPPGQLQRLVDGA